MKAKKLYDSLAPEEQSEYRKKAWAGYDYDNIPPMTPEQLATFKKVDAQRHKQFCDMKKLGRPKKPQEEKEIPVSIRFPSSLLTKIKRQAQKFNLPWQTFMKKFLDENLRDLRN